MSFRTEHKISVSAGRVIDAIDWISQSGAIYLHDKRTVFSTYFDNDSMSMYHDSEEGVVPRKKIRIRVYNEMGDAAKGGLLEQKISSVEGRFKKSTFMDKSEVDLHMRQGIFDDQYGFCRPVVQVKYSREYFKINSTRITLDSDIRYCGVGGFDWVEDGMTSMEIKATYAADQNELMQGFPFMRARFSKYSRACDFAI